MSCADVFEPTTTARRPWYRPPPAPAYLDECIAVPAKASAPSKSGTRG